MPYDNSNYAEKMKQAAEAAKGPPPTVEQRIAASTAQKNKVNTSNYGKSKESNAGAGGGNGNSKAILGHQEEHITDHLKDMPAGCQYIISNNKKGVVQFDVVLPNDKDQIASEIEHTLQARVWKNPKQKPGYEYRALKADEQPIKDAEKPKFFRIEGEARVVDFMNELALAGKGPLVIHKPGFLPPSDAIQDAYLALKQGRQGGAARGVAGDEQPKKGLIGKALERVGLKRPQPPSS